MRATCWDSKSATLDDLDPAADGGLQAIVLSDVLEHLDDPVAALAQIAALLVPGGVICVVTPDPSSLPARLAGARLWRSFTFGCWVAGLGERSGPLSGLLTAVRRLGIAHRHVTLALGDERVVIARR